MRERLRTATRVLRNLGWWRFAAGSASGGAALLLSFLLQVLGIGVFLPVVAVDFVVTHIPGSVESLFIDTMGEGAKYFGIVVSVGVFLALSGAYAMPFRVVQRRLRGRWLVLAAYAAGYALAALLVILPILGGGLLGSETAAGAGFATFSQVLAAWIYAAVLDHILVDVAARHPEGFQPTRRHFIVGLGILFVGAAAALAGFGSLLARTGRLVFPSVDDLFAHEETPNSEFYVVTKNVFDPAVDVSAWRLAVDGLVSSPRSYAYRDLLERMDTEAYVTFECISNDVGGNLISTARWRGIRLEDVLAEAGIHPEADWIAFECADGYTVGVPRSRAVAAGAILAFEMKDEALPPAHGFPARIVVPGLYGMFDAKWVTRITAVKGEFLGFWQQKGWSNQGDIRTTAITTTPPPDSVVRGPVTIAGIAFAGDRGISRVEVSTDGGTVWADATLKTPPLIGATWVLWKFPWSPPSSGAHRILARAVDGNGVPQSATRAPPFPAGASGYDAITLLASL